MKQYRRSASKCMLLLLTAVLVLLPAAGCSSKQDDKPVVKHVTTTLARKSAISISVEYAGKVVPIEEVTIASKLPGRVELVKADVGSSVKKGDMLFSLDTKSVDAQLKQSKAAVDNAQAGLIMATDSTIAQQVTELTAAVEQAQLQYDDAKRSYDRVKQLYDSSAASKKQLEDADTYLKNSEVKLNSLKENLKIFNERSAPQTAAIASAQLEQAEAAYEAASVQAVDSSIVAPISGVVSMRNIDEGEFVAGGIPVFTVINTETVMVSISVPDTIVEKLHTGYPVPVKITALSGQDFTGIIDTISPAADPQTLAYTVKIKLENGGNAIKPGMLAKVSLPLDSKENIVLVPNEAILVQDAAQYIYIVEGGKVKKVQVTTGITNAEFTEVTGGLKEGEPVITEGQSFLNDGENVSMGE